MKCPVCGSEKIQFGTNTSSGGFNVGKGCCGYMILGPLGILCGACGSATKTEEFWVCQSCGHRFTAQQANQVEQKITQLKAEQKKSIEAESVDSTDENNISSESTPENGENDASAEVSNENRSVGYKVVLRDTGGQILKAIMIIREATGCGLAEAKAIAETTFVIKICFEKEEAEYLVNRFASEGILTEIVEIKNED